MASQTAAFRAGLFTLLLAATGALPVFIFPAHAGENGWSLTAPGWAWGRFRYPERFERTNAEHLTYDLIAEQGFRFSKDKRILQPEVFVRLDLKRDNQFLDYDNRAKPAAGARLWLSPLSGLKTYAGVRYDHEYRWQTGASAGGLTLFAGWQGWWQLYERQDAALGRLTLSTWGEVRSPYSHFAPEAENIVSEGGAQADLSLYRFSDTLSILQRGGLEYTIDSERLPYRNWLKPSLGLVLQYDSNADTRFEFVARAAAEWRFEDHQIDSGYSVFATYARSWRLPASF